MFRTLVNAFKIKDIRKRLFYTIAALLIVRLGSQLPVPGTNPEYFQQWFASQSGDAFSFFDAFTGGSFTSMSVFALGITPYIMASIIVQMLTLSIPKLEEMSREEDGHTKIQEATRYATVGLALFEAIGMAVGFGQKGLLREFNALNVVATVAALTAGSAFVMWLGEQITEKGIGNGSSIILVFNIASRIPADISGLFTQFVTSAGNVGRAILAAIIIIAVILIVIILTVLLNDGVRKIPVHYNGRSNNSRIAAMGNTNHIPLRVNTSGVMPVIFASSIMQFPVIIWSMFNLDPGTGVWSHILKALQSSYWFKAETPYYTLGLLLYVVLVIFFAYFYTAITFNPVLISDNLKKRGGFIPGVRPGRPTTEYLNNILQYIIFIGAVGLFIVVTIPIVFNGIFGASVTFAGTSLIIIVSVVLEAIRQVETMMVERNYKGFLNS
ncbi:MAG: preprotein translocase subunit SecY [Lachnospiraceae bacterium]|jgi:preprotein translocase subunit SecY|nr:preprotein translocase subunit SecY [Lachnospiraceae bacterium]